jgi:UDP-N-acetylglucosamine transferase subunit ALG13
MKNKKICLAASGGGHLRQLVQMLPSLKDYDYYFLTEPTPLGLSLKENEKVRLVPHFAFGQRKSEGLFKFLWAGLSNLFSSIVHFLRERPDVIISTGAGAAFFTLYLAHLFRKKIIYLESIARVRSISLFGKISAKYADHYLVQWPALLDEYDKAEYCNPFIEKELHGIEKKDKIFVTVGTVMPFDRLIGYVECLQKEGLISEEIICQVGESEISPENMEVYSSLKQDEMISHLKDSSIAIVHGGSGSMLGAIREGCIVIAMPRQAELGEHYDDHQFELVGAFKEMGLVTEVRTLDELRQAILQARTMKPKTVEIDPSSYGRFFDKYIK